MTNLFWGYTCLYLKGYYSLALLRPGLKPPLPFQCNLKTIHDTATKIAQNNVIVMSNILE